MIWYYRNCLEVPCRSSFILLRCWCVQFFQDSCCWWFWCLRIGKAARFEQQVWLGLIRKVEVEDFRWRSMDVSKNRGGPPKWMVYDGWFGGTIIFGNTHIEGGGTFVYSNVILYYARSVLNHHVQKMSFTSLTIAHFGIFFGVFIEHERFWDVTLHFWVDWLWHFVYFSTASEKNLQHWLPVSWHTHTHHPQNSTWSSAIGRKNIISKHKQLKEHVYKILKIQFYPPKKTWKQQTQWNSPWCWRKPSETPIKWCFGNQPKWNKHSPWRNFKGPMIQEHMDLMDMEPTMGTGGYLPGKKPSLLAGNNPFFISWLMCCFFPTYSRLVLWEEYQMHFF